MENLADEILEASKALHWLGKWREAAALTFLSRAVRAMRLGGLEDLEAWVTGLEAEAAKVEGPSPRAASA